mmetsp:Transcript_42955/g.110921  ORF Transcript_42955/g.110921 Transcript_42955/m.110921 type:complete len:82 (+) Transcript_42955:310-555(+)
MFAIVAPLTRVRRQGDEAIRKARLMGIEIPIIAVTRMVQDTYHKKQLVEAGATNFTPKPVRPAAVRALLHYHAAPLLSNEE